MSGDRILEAYRGEFGEAQSRIARDRIHWICRQAQGRSALDVGCSQGICTILLAREGYEVIGVDPDGESIAFAKEQTSKEEPDVQARITFLKSTLETAELDERKFDTIILGEVIEHVVFPEHLLDAAFTLLDESGRLVLTTPFGVHEHFDHKHSFYIDDLLAVAASQFVPLELSIHDGYLLLCARRRRQDEPPGSLSQGRSELGDDYLLKLGHDAMVERERRHLQDKGRIQELRQGHYRELELTRKKLERMERLQKDQTASPSENETQRKLLNKKVEQIADRIQGLQKTLADLSDLVTGKLGDYVSRSSERHTAPNGLGARTLERELEQCKRSLQVAQQKRAGHYRELVLQRTETEKLQTRLEDILDSKRYRLAAVLAESRRSVWKFISLPVELLRELRWRNRGRAHLTPWVQTRHRRHGRDGNSPTDNHLSVQTVTQSTRPILRPLTDPIDTHDLRIAAILDDMSYACFAPECELVSFTPNSWESVLEGRPPNMLLVESAWQGNGGSWQYKVGKYNHPDSAGLERIIEWCRDRGVPTVFWNKEDPIHFAKFKDSARLFDYVLTSDANSIARYENLEGLVASNIEAMTFAAQPRLHNLSGVAQRLDAPCFAGSYYANRHIRRRAKMEGLLDVAAAFGLVIYDRNLGTNDPAFQFPTRFRRYIKGRLSYEELTEVYKRHKVFLNVNSVEDSPTMLSRRVFELLACGTAVVSTPSKAIKTLFGDIVEVVETEDEIRAALERLIHDEEHRRQKVLQGWRMVFREHTYEKRIQQIASLVGFNDCAATEPSATVVVTGVTGDTCAPLCQAWAAQTVDTDLVLGVAEEKEFVKVGEIAEKFLSDAGSVKVRAQSTGEEREGFRELAKFVKSEWVAILDQDATDAYTQHHIEDLLNCTKFARADVIGVPTVDAAEHEYGERVRVEGCIARRSVVLGKGWLLDRSKANDLMTQCRRSGVSIYQAHRGSIS